MNLFQHDAFHGQLEKAEDGFSVVADYFGRGLFRPQIDLATLRNVGEQKVVAASSGPRASAPPTIATALATRTLDQVSIPSARPVELKSKNVSIPVRNVEKQLQQMSLTKTQMIPIRPAEQQPAKQSSVPTDKLIRSNRASSPAASTVKTSVSRASLPVAPASKVVRQPSPLAAGGDASAAAGANPFGNDFEESENAKNPFGDPDDENYDDKLNPFS